MMPPKTAPLDHHLTVPLTRLEFVLLTWMSHRDGHDAQEWVRRLLTLAVRSELHSKLKEDLLGRIKGDVIVEDEQ